MADDENGRLRPTSLVTLGGMAVGGLIVGWFSVDFFERGSGIAPAVPWTSVFLLAFAAAALGGTAWSTWRALHRDGHQLESHKAVNRLVLAKASAIVGALMAGLYVGFGMRFLDDLPATLPQERVLRSAAATVAAVLVVVAALLLERACRVPKDTDEESGASPNSG